MRSDGRAGASEWATETMEHFVRFNSAEARGRVNGSEISAGSGSVVLVDAKDEPPKGEFVNVQNN